MFLAMKNLPLLLLIALMGTYATTAFSKGNKETRYIVPDRENFRLAPNGKKIGTLNHATKLKVIDKQGDWIKVNVEGWMYKPSTSEKLLKKGAASYVEHIKSKYQSLLADQKRKTKPRAPHLRAYFQFRNNSEKTIKAMRYEVEFTDQNGKALHEAIMNSTVRIAPGRKNRMTSFWYWKSDPFNNDEPYDRMRGPVETKTLTANIKIKEIVFHDNEKISF